MNGWMHIFDLDDAHWITKNEAKDQEAFTLSPCIGVALETFVLFP